MYHPGYYGIHEQLTLDQFDFDYTTSTMPHTVKFTAYGCVDMVVDWGDGGGTDTYNGTASCSHAYATPDTYTVSITSGTATNIRFGLDAGTTPTLLTRVGWVNPNLGLNSAAYMFRSVVNSTFDTAFFDDASGNITDFNQMFRLSNFNAAVSGWNLSRATSIFGIFYDNTTFNQDVGDWVFPLCTSMYAAFYGCTSFVGTGLDDWDVSDVQNMGYLFYGCTSLATDITGWDTGSATKFNYMFAVAETFNQNLGSWNTANVDAMNAMFYLCSSFNQNLNSWDIRKVTITDYMFQGTVIKQSFADWKPEALLSAVFMFVSLDINDPNSATNQTNYDALLNGWAAEAVLDNVRIDVTNTKYSAAGAASRTHLATTHSWTIYDNGQA